MENKNILVLSTGDTNGAYEAAYRIAKFLNDALYNVTMVVKYKTKKDSFIHEVSEPKTLLTKILAKGKEKIFPKSQNFDTKYFFLDEDERKNYVDYRKILDKCSCKPDLILMGMTDGFLNTRTLLELYKATESKVVMLTVDMSPLTGGCHFAWDCKGYLDGCKKCPAVIDKKAQGYPAINYALKKKHIREANIKILAGSGWTLNQARQSGIFKNQKNIFNINSCIDTDVFNAKHRAVAKSIFNIDNDCKVIFCGSQNITDERKGFAYFIEALNQLYNKLDDSIKTRIIVLVIGKDSSEEVKKMIPFNTHVMDYIKDYRLLSLVYQASDIFVCASIEDSGPMMVSEALACGTPVVGFEMGVVSNMVINGHNGYKAQLRNSEDLCSGIETILKLSDEETLKYSLNAFERVYEMSSKKTVLHTINEILDEC